MTCPSGLTPFDTYRKARKAAHKRVFESQGRARYTVPLEACIRCGFWHMQRSE